MQTCSRMLLFLVVGTGLAYAGCQLTDGVYTHTPTGGSPEQHVVTAAGTSITWGEKEYTWEPTDEQGNGRYRWRDENGDWHYLEFNGTQASGTYDDSDASGSNNGTYRRGV